MTPTFRVLNPDGSEPDLAEIALEEMMTELKTDGAWGPVMPEVPSEDVIAALYHLLGLLREDSEGVYTTIRSCLLNEQGKISGTVETAGDA